MPTRSRHDFTDTSRREAQVNITGASIIFMPWIPMWRMNVYNRKGWDIENREVVEETAIMTVDVQPADGALPAG